MGVVKNASVYMSNGSLYMTSDERLKNYDGDIKCDLDELSSIPKKYFYWKDREDRKNIGTSAQALEKVYPELVTKDETGEYGVAYDKLSIVSLAAVDKLYDLYKEAMNEIKTLKAEIEDLKNKN